jgi:predicted transposase YdaD
LLWLGEALAGLVLTSERDKLWIKERFHPMIHEILKESWVYQEAVQEAEQKAEHIGMQKGQQKTLQDGIVRFVKLRFPALLTLVQEALVHETTLEELQVTQDKLFLSNTLEEATAALQEHGTKL